MSAAESALNAVTVEFERRFKHIHYPPCFEEVISLAFPTPQQPAENIQVGSIITIPFVILTSGEEEDPRRLGAVCPILHPDEKSAVAAFHYNLQRFMQSLTEPEALYWRTKPSLKRETDFESDRAGWTVYCRFGVKLAPHAALKETNGSP